MVDAAGSICKACGLFTGCLPTLLEDVPDMACKFAAYETMRYLHRNFVGGRKASAAMRPLQDFAHSACSTTAASSSVHERMCLCTAHTCSV